MKTPLKLIWNDLEPSTALTTRIARGVDELARTFGRITACRVTLAMPHANHYQVNIALSVPGRVLAVTRDPTDVEETADAFTAVNEAFWKMREQLEDYVRVTQQQLSLGRPKRRAS